MPITRAIFLVAVLLDIVEPHFEFVVDAPHPLRGDLVRREVLLPTQNGEGMLDRLVEIEWKFGYGATIWRPEGADVSTSFCGSDDGEELGVLRKSFPSGISTASSW